MGFGINLDVKVEVPKVDAGTVTSAVSAAVGSVTDAAKGAVDAATSAVAGAVGAAAEAASSLASVAGAIAEVAVSFTGAIEDLVLEPHLQLSANASYEETHFEKGPVRIRIEMTEDEARASTDSVCLFSESGDYHESRGISEFADSNGSSVVILFEDVPMNQSYSLQLVPEDGEPRTLLCGVPYGHMRKSKDGYLNDGADA